MIHEAKGIFQDGGEAWVGFGHNTGLTWLKLLKPGFRHCFLLLRKQDFWLVYDPLSHHTRIDLVEGGYELLDLLCERGCRLLPAAVAVPRRRALPWRPFSCVEAVKRALGIRAGWVLTPWQLYRYLARRHGA